jgi:cytochrome P450
MPIIFSVHSNDKIKQWEASCNASRCGSVKIDFTREIVELTLSIICDASFGYNFKLDNSIGVLNFFNDVSEEMNKKMVDPFEWWPIFFPQRRARSQRAVDAIVGILDNIVGQRLEEYNSGTQLQADATPRDLLDILLHASQGDDAKLSAKELRDHSLTFLAAGHETTGNTLLWLFFELAKNPHIQKQCHDEVDFILPSSLGPDITVSYEQVGRFIYLGQCIKETLRLHPPAQVMGRSNVNEAKIGKYRIPPNSILGICILAVHQHPDFWENPLEFFPDRFHPDSMRSTIKHPFQYIPFSFGPRNCIGQRFATIEATTILALILRKFTVHMNSDDINGMKVEETITCGPRSMRVTLTPRS